ncbi:high mobility group box, partial [Rhizopogon vinicolor AM-OR11-026]
IPRPPNAFIVFRSCLWSNEDFRSLESDHRNVSRIAGERWRNLSDDEKEPFVQMAREAKALHAKMYPNYKYSPSHRSVAGSKRK